MRNGHAKRILAAALAASMAALPVAQAQTYHYRIPLEGINAAASEDPQAEPFTVGSYAPATIAAGETVSIGAPTVSGGRAPYAFAAVAGLPQGTSLSAGGAITGTPPAGTHTVTVRVTDADQRAEVRTASIIVTGGQQGSPITVSGIAATFAGTVGESLAIPAPSVSGGTAPYTFSGSAGLIVNAQTGAATLTPATAGPAAHAITAHDSLGATGQVQFTVETAAQLAFGAGVGPYAGTAGTAGTFALPSLTGGRGPFTYSDASGGGRVTNLTAATGQFLAAAPGTYEQVIRAQDADGRTAFSPAITFEIAAPLSAHYATSYYGIANVAVTIPPATVSGGTAPYATTPATGSGLTADGSGGYSFTGPAGTHGPFQATVTDAANRTANPSFSVQVAPVIAVSGYPASYSGTANVTNTAGPATTTGGFGDFTYEISPAGDGVSVNANTGAVTYTKPGGTHGPYTVTARDQRGFTGTAAPFTIEIAAPLALSYTLDNPIRVNQTSTWTANRTSGTGPFSYALKTGAVPLGMSLDTTTGHITGQPTQSGNGSFSVEVTDAGAGNAKATSQVVNWTSTTIDDAATWAKVSNVNVTGLSNGSGDGASNKASLSDKNFNVYNYPSGIYSGKRFGSVSTLVGNVQTTIQFNQDVAPAGMIVRMRYTVGSTTAPTPGNITLSLRNAGGTVIGTIVHPITGSSSSTFAFTNIPINVAGIRSIVMSTSSASTDVTFSEIEWM